MHALDKLEGLRMQYVYHSHFNSSIFVFRASSAPIAVSGGV